MRENQTKMKKVMLKPEAMVGDEQCHAQPWGGSVSKTIQEAEGKFCRSLCKSETGQSAQGNDQKTMIPWTLGRGAGEASSFASYCFAVWFHSYKEFQAENVVGEKKKKTLSRGNNAAEALVELNRKPHRFSRETKTLKVNQ